MFTIISLPAVIWAKVSDEKVSVRVQGEPAAVDILKGDDLFDFYSNKFKEHRDNMLTPPTESQTELPI
jgi:hypothetical protein